MSRVMGVGITRVRGSDGELLVSSELKAVDDGYRKEGIRHDRVSSALEQLVKAKAFVHFLNTGLFAIMIA